MDYEKARSSTHEKLSGRLGDLACGKDLKSLQSFAKAYLGMYLDLDKALEPDQRVSLLADENDINSIWSGFDALLCKPMPTPEQIGAVYANNERMAEGYVILAALDRHFRRHDNPLDKLSDEQFEALVCFNYANRNELERPWIIECVALRAGAYADALLRFWRQLPFSRNNNLPGFRQVLQDVSYRPVLEQLVLPVLVSFPHINKKSLKLLLLHAVQIIPLPALLDVCREHIEDTNDMPVVNHVYWLTMAYILAPQQHQQLIMDYVGRTREKALPMLAFIESLIDQDEQKRLGLDAAMIAHFIHMIAPRFRPTRDQFGRLDDNVQKIERLFKLLGQDKSTEARQAVLELRQVRVLRVYSDFIDQVELQQSGLKP